MMLLLAMLVIAVLPATPVGADVSPDAPPGPPPFAGEKEAPGFAPGSPPRAGEPGPPDFDPLPFEPGPFTFFVESGEVVIGIGEEEPFEIQFSECPGGEPAEDECITFEGDIDTDGEFTIEPEDVSFPQALFTEPLPIAVTTGVSEAATGTIDPATGDATMSLPMQIDLDIFANGVDDCRIVVDLELTSGTSGILTGDPLVDGRMSLVDGMYAIPVTTVLSDVGAAVCPIVDGTLALPSESGENTAVFDLLMVPGHLDG